MINLKTALRAKRGDLIAFAGSGGKTTSIFTLARQFSYPVLITTSTHLGSWQAHWADQHFIIREKDSLHLEKIDGVILVTGEPAAENRLNAVSPRVLGELYQISKCQQIPLLIKADGSRQKPVKAPASHEPAIPSWVNKVVYCLGLSGYGAPLSENCVHHHEIFSYLTGLTIGAPINQTALINYLTHPLGARKNIPDQCLKYLLLTQANCEHIRSIASGIARNIADVFDSVLIQSENTEENLKRPSSNQPIATNILAVYEPIGGIVLAAGSASRFGEAKMLVEWNGKPLIRHIVEQGLAACLSPMIIVTGYFDSNIRNAVEGLNVQVVHNPNWEEGVSSSIQVGLQTILSKVGAALFILADQPFQNSQLIDTLVDHHRQSMSPIIAPMVEGKRGNPVLFDRVTFPDLMNLKGDIGGRGIFSKYPIQWINWYDQRVLIDIDTPDDYHHSLEFI